VRFIELLIDKSSEFIADEDSTSVASLAVFSQSISHSSSSLCY